MKKIPKLILFFLFLYLFYYIFPYFIKINIQKIPSSTIVYDENHIELWEIISNKKYRHQEIKIDEIPDFLKKSIVSIEDRRFYSHSWIDYIWIIRAFKNNIFWNNLQWASTIENQIIRNNYWLNKDRNYTLKIKEFLLSLALNKVYSKDEILEMYLNNINFWYLNYWFSSASRFYYNKDLNNLTQAEMLWLIIIIKNPNKYNPLTNLSNFNKRFNLLTNYLVDKNIISKSKKDEILEEKLTFYKGKKDNLPYVVDFLKWKANNWESKIYTNIDFNLTKKIDLLSKNTLKSLAWKNVWDYSIIIIDRKKLDLKVMIWWNDYYNKDEWQVNWSLALRQPWSTLKPFLYALYFKDFNKNPSSTILDIPISYKTSDWYSYEPKNYSLTFAWEVTLAESLSQSINIPAVKILNDLKVDNFLKFLRELNINSLNKDSDFYGLSLALWSWEVSLYELTRAYSLFAKWWNICDINIIKNKDSNSCKKIIDEKYISMVEEILTNRYFKLAWFPINSNLDFANREVFVKTWTSRNFKDNLSIWYTKDYIIWVWVWNKNWSEMMWVSGATWAWEIFRKIVYALDNNDIKSDIISLDKESQKYINITSPLDKNTFEVNNSIPLKSQEIKLSFSTNIDFDYKKWSLNKKEVNWKFINIDLLNDKNLLKLELYKNNILIWYDEIEIYLNQ